MKPRGRLDFIAGALRAAEDGRTKTEIMYSAFMSYSQANLFLRFLVGRGLLEYERETGLFSRTKAGDYVLLEYDGMVEAMGIERFAGRSLRATRESMPRIQSR
jgi:predicted transcriptional regulator